jgi:hypothetical protein
VLIKRTKFRMSGPVVVIGFILLLIPALGMLFGVLMLVLFYSGGMQPVEDVPYNRFLELLDNKQIVSDKNYPLQLVVEDGRPTQTLRGAYIRQGVGSAPAQQIPFRTTVYLSFTNDLQQKLAAAGIQPARKTESNMLAQTVFGFFGFVVVGGFSIFVIVTSFVGGLVGWLLIMRKRVLECTHCGAIVPAS